MCESNEQLQSILRAALTRTYQEMASLPTPILGRELGRLWNKSLSGAFRDEFPHLQVFSRGAPREYLHDIFVAEVENRPAPYNTMRRVERVKRVIWQCESEIILNAVGVEKDIGKLVAGAADHKLLVAGLPSRGRVRIR
jgi:hypothetical protein